MEHYSPNPNSAFADIVSEESDDQERLGDHVSTDQMTLNFRLLHVHDKLSKTEESLKLCLENTNISLLESVVAPGLNSQLQWIITKLRITSPMLKAAIERTKSRSASEVETRKLESFAISVSEITRLIDQDITGSLMSKEGVEYSSPTKLSTYARQFDGNISTVEAQINGLHEWATTLGLTSAECGQTSMCRTNIRCIVEANTENERKDAGTVGLEEDVQLITNKLILGQKTPALVANYWWKSIAKQVLIGFAENDPIEKIKYKLSRLWWFQRYLIVLDDAHAIEEATKTILELSSKKSNGSKILITTTKRELLIASPSCYIHERRVLDDDEAWELFNAGLCFQVDQQLEQLAREIVKKCSGCPLSVLKLSHFMSSKKANQEHWIITLSQMNDPYASHYLSLTSSSDIMSSNKRQCLLYFILFPQNEIPARRLIVLWVAEGLVDQAADSAETPESAGEKILNELVQNCMIQVAKWKPNGKVKTCRLDYRSMDTLQKEAGKTNFLKINLQVAASMPSSNNSTILRVADHLDNTCSIFSHIHEIDSIGPSSFKHHYKQLISFLSFDSREGPVPGQDIGNFIYRGIKLNCLRMLRVLDLEGTFRPKLPDSIIKLSQLRYLGLRHTYTELLPEPIGNLSNLQTLDLKHTCLRSIPGSIWKLKQLRHLYLSESYRSRIMAPGSSISLLNIQTLWGVFVDDETRIEDGLKKLTNLIKLGLVYRSSSRQQGNLANWISKLHHLESLRLRSVNDINNPDCLYLKTISGLNKLSSLYFLGKLANPFVLEALPESLTEITLSFSGLTVDPMRTLEKLPYLRILNLYAGSYTNNTMVCSSGGFPLLRVLNLWNLEELEEWIVKDGSLIILRHLEIRSCIKLKRIPEGLKNLEHCRELKLTNMPDDFKARVTKDQGLDWQNVAHIASVIVKN